MSFVPAAQALMALLASMPCQLPQVIMQPRTNTTAAQEPIVLFVARDAALPRPTEELISVEAADGTPVRVQVEVVDAGYLTRANIRGLKSPGWYTVRLAAPPKGRESSDRSLFVTDKGFYGEVLVGASDPGVALVRRCPPSVVLSWSEPVVFDEDPASAIELRTDTGTPLACALTSSLGDAGVRTTLPLTCDGGLVTSMTIVRPPHTLDGGVATFPPAGEPWDMTAWAQDQGCSYWQPSVWRRTHENLSAGNLAATYEKCDTGGGCGCSENGSSGIWSLGLALLLASLWGLRRAR